MLEPSRAGGDPGVRRSAERVRLAFVTGRSLSERGGRLWTDAGLGRLVDLLGERFDLRVAASVMTAATHEHRLALHPDRLVPLPPMRSTAGGFAKVRACRRALERLDEESDVALVQLPFPAPLALLGARRPRVYHVCADVLQVVQTSPFYRGVRRPAALGMARLIHAIERRLVGRPGARAVVNGRALYEALGVEHGRAVVSSALLASEVGQAVRRRPAGAPFRVLFVGYLRPEKGVDVLLAAFDLVRAARPDAELVIVGARDLGERGVGRALQRALQRLESGGAVRFAGQIEYGPALFQLFADGDVLAVPSRSEGTPRVLIEARAFGCPVVATGVGGIPTSVEHGVDGLLVPPEEPGALAAALLRVAEDRELRRRLVAQGFERARRTTVEAFADQLADEVRLAAARGAG